MALEYLDGRQLAGTGGEFVSEEQTGNGSEQSVAHGLGRTPSKVFVIWQGSGTFTVAYGTHTSTHVKVTVANTAKYLVIAR